MPLLLALVFGMLSGGLSYNRKLALTNGVREGSRYGSTLAVAQARTQTSPACALTADLDCWLTRVAEVTQQAAEGELSSSTSGLELCVAYVHPAGTATNDRTRVLKRTSSGDDFTGGCAGVPFADDRATGERRVQVIAKRNGKLELLVSSMSLTLRSQSVTRFEAVP